MRRGTRLGVDLGAARVGVAVSDPDGLVATPVATLPRREALRTVAVLVRERDAAEVVVGLPRTLGAADGPAAAQARAWARRLAQAVAPVPVRLVDERLTTAAATRGLRATGVGTRRGRSVVDQAAAAMILQGALDEERARGAPPGEPVAPADRPPEEA